MAQISTKFEDILEPRRQEFSNFCWSSRELQITSPYKQYSKLTPKQHKLDVLNSSKIIDIIEKLSKDKRIPLNEIKAEVEIILDEIGFKHNQVLLRWLSLFLTKITCKIYTGIYVNRDILNQIKLNSKNVPVVYVPTHRSYGDFILMSYIFYASDIAIPAIAAGMDFHGMKGMGTMLRNTGAFFMRRSYNNDSLYWDVFRQYIYQIISKHDAGIEFFIEGMRSRSNKSLPPKFGLLFMLLRALITSEVPDILFIPINISYDRIIEEQLFTFELLGIPKPKESTMKFFKALRIIKENYGQIYVDIGKPISTRQFFENKIDRLKHILKPVYMEELSNVDKSNMVNLAEHIVDSQKELTILNTFNIIAVILNNNLFMQTNLKYEDLVKEIMWLQHILERIGASTTSQYSEKCIKNSLDVHNNLVHLDENCNVLLVPSSVIFGQHDAARLKGHSLTQETMNIAVPIIMLHLYVNPVLYYLINKSFLVKVLKHSNTENISKEYFLEDYSFLRQIFAKEFTLFNNKLQSDFTNNLNDLIELDVIHITNGMYHLHGNDKLQNLLLNIVEPFLLVYYTVGVVLSQMNQNTCSEKHIFATTQEKIEAIILENNVFVHPYSLSLDTISLCLESFSTMSALRKKILNRLVNYEINRNILNITIEKLEKYAPRTIVEKLKMGIFKNKL